MKRSSFITWDQLRVGLVILAALAILTLAVYKLGQAANLFTKRYTLVAFLKEANGLREGGTVTLAGQLAGGIVRGEGTIGQLVTNRALYDQLTGTLSRTNTMLAKLQNPNGTVGRLLDDPTLYTQITNMIASTDTLVRSVNSAQGTLGKMLRDTVLYGNMVRLSTGADSLVRMLTNGNGLASKL